MTDWNIALGVKPMQIDFATPLMQAARLHAQEQEAQQQQQKYRMTEMNSEARGLAAYADKPEFAQKWGESADRMLQKGLIDPQTHQQWRDNPSPLMLKQMLAQSETPEMSFRRDESVRSQKNADREFTANQGFRSEQLALSKRAADRADDKTPANFVADPNAPGGYRPIGPADPAYKASVAEAEARAKGNIPQAVYPGAEFVVPNKAGEGALYKVPQAPVAPGALMPDATAEHLAERVLAGDTRALIGLGRGAQGAENLTKIQGIVAAKAKERGMDASDILAKASENAGITAQQRTFGTQTAKMAVNATEAGGAIELGRAASAAVPRTNWVPVNRAIQAYQSGTSDPALAKFGAANLAIINTYARAINPNGVGTVHDKEHAERLLSTATGPEAYSAILDQMNAEIDIAHKAAPKAKKELEELRKGGKTQPSDAAPAKPGVIDFRSYFGN